MNFPELIEKRYATKKFDGRVVSQDIIDQLLEYMRMAPSSMNFQPWKFVVVTDPAVKEALQPATWNQAQITTCSHLIVICAYTDREAILASINKAMKDAGADDELVGKRMAYVTNFVSALDADRMLSWAQKQCYIAMENILLGAKYLGVDSCPMEGFLPEKYSEILKLPANIVPTLVVPIGYPGDEPHSKVRLSIEDLVINV